MRPSIFIVAMFLVICSFSRIAQADLASPGCKCETGSSTSTRGAAAACTVFGISVLVLGRKRTRKL